MWLTMDAYAPRTKIHTPLPAVILIHGGGWTLGGDRGNEVPVATQLAENDLVTFSINYTLATSKLPSWPNAFDDTQGAVSYLHAHAVDAGHWDIEPAHIGAMGDSAGANMAAMLGTCDPSVCSIPPIQAVVSNSGPMDLTALGCSSAQTCPQGAGGGVLHTYLGCWLDQCPATYAEASPVTDVSATTAPILFWNSDNELIPVDQVTQMATALHAVCAGYRFAVLPGNQHGAYVDVTLPASIAFLQQELGASPPSLGCTQAPPQTDTAVGLDAASGDLVAFGGCCNADGTLLDDTWTFDGTSWTLEHPATSPPARIGASLAWDPQSQQMILFGGELASDPYNAAVKDTWEWNGTDWTMLIPSTTATTSPPARSEASLAYDATSHALILFGGEASPTDFNNAQALGDTWEWNGTTWTEAAAKTADLTGRYGAAMATDPATGHPILFGGDTTTSSCEGSCLSLLSDTWEWNGATWVKLTQKTSPSPRELASAASESGGNGIVLFGGLNGKTTGPSGNQTNTETLLRDTWVFAGGVWAREHPSTTPAARFGTSMGSGSATGEQAVLEGGFTGSTQDSAITDIWDGTNWSPLALERGGGAGPSPRPVTDGLTAGVVDSH